MTMPLDSAHSEALSATRTACVRIANWPLLAALEVRERAGEPVPDHCALMESHRVCAVDPAAAHLGVVEGMKKRAAQALSPDLVLLERDRDAEWSVFETVASAVDTVASGVESLHPGTLLLHAHGPARHAGGEAELAQALLDAVADLTGWECAVGIADGPLAAILASLTGRIVKPGESARFLAPHALSALMHAPLAQSARFRYRERTADDPRTMSEAIGLLHRLGLSTLGDFAALPHTSVAERFGPQLALAHVLARGGEPSEPPRHRAQQPVLVERSLDPPLERVDQAAFVARPMADELEEELRRRAEVCTRLRIVARSEHGDELERTWRHDGALSTSDVVDRVRWQCDAWIRSAAVNARRAPEHQVRTGAIVHLQLIPVQLMSAAQHAPGLWGKHGEKAARATRALTRVQSMAGENSVLVPRKSGGRLASETMRMLPFRSGEPARLPNGPWPGRPPAPLPTTVFSPRPAVRLTDMNGNPVVIDARGVMSAPPCTLTFIPTSDADSTPRLPAALASYRPGSPCRVTAYGAPHVIDQQWWSPSRTTAHRGARMQTVLDNGNAFVLLSEAGHWEVEALYD